METSSDSRDVDESRGRDVDREAESESLVLRCVYTPPSPVLFPRFFFHSRQDLTVYGRMLSVSVGVGSGAISKLSWRWVPCIAVI